MIPAIVAWEVRKTIEDFLQTRYRISTPSLAQAVREFIDSGEAFQGSYMSFQLPFEKGVNTGEPFPDIPLGFKPYLHQERAFERLTANPPKPTIIATGTGSGKTEAFLYPILDYCRQVADEPGIKAILIYPMNALATDQAKRLAGIIYNNPSLKEKIMAGLYIGGATPRGRMTESNIISNRHKLRESPPDLLLTNYKMLDYLLIRPNDARLWERNRAGTLRYIVVDELHVFDGAQGTDLACLLRRLKARLQAKDLCPIGTSATLGSGSSDKLLDYAEKIFDTKFNEDALITEARLDPRDFLMESPSTWIHFPDTRELSTPDQFDSIAGYIQTQYKAWFGAEVSTDGLATDEWRKELGAKLREHIAFQNLIRVVAQKALASKSEYEKLALPVGSETQRNVDRPQLLESLLSLISYALDPNDLHKPRPLLELRVQFWMRELKRMVVSVEEKPRLVWDSDLAGQTPPHHLPLASCIKCGTAGWMAAHVTEDDPLTSNIDQIYGTYFGRKSDAKLKVIYPDADPSLTDQGRLCQECLKIFSPRTVRCDECENGGTLIKVHVPSLKIDPRRGKPECPHCGESNQPGIFGAGGITLLSAALGQTFASRYNDDRKVLTFSDSVQDAAHRAGYFEARTYTFSVRTALLQYLETVGGDQGIRTIADGLVQSQLKKLGREDFVGTFIAPNMIWMDDYETLVKKGYLPKGSHLPSMVAKRLKWEVYLNLGLRARRGRTLEKTLSAAVSLDQDLLNDWIDRALPDIKARYEGLQNVDQRAFKQFLTGFIYRLRTCGGIVHDKFFDEYIRSLGRNKRCITEKHLSWMPRYRPNGPYHGFLSSGAAQNFLPLTGSRSNSWVQGWAHKCFLEGQMTPSGFEAALREIVNAAPADLLKQYTANRYSVWGIEPDALKVTTQVRPLACATCHYEVSIPQQDEKIWQGMPCLMHRCAGHFQRIDDREIDYYKALYRSGDVRRFVPKEHTALLTPEDRETVEKTFMRDDQRPWDPNIVSCTPTLELGIDIGDLSTVFLCSVPPAQANYVQRIGRAGRKNGNSFGFTVATNKPHDLYFFADPGKMISDEVQVPGVFLKAPAVLQRQMAAYSMDMWVAHTKEADVPNQLRYVLGALKDGDIKRFPFNWLGYVDIHSEKLAKGFQELFPNLKDLDILQSATHFFSPHSTSHPQLRQIVLNALQEKYNSRKQLNNRIRRLQRRINALDDKPRDENYESERKNLKDHLRGLRHMRYSIGETNVFNFLSDEGILPNYAFPQSGAQLFSTVLPDRNKETVSPITETFDRPGHQAIQEFAPGNYFYANGKKVRISGIRFDKDDVQPWRFCPDCSWYELDSEEVTRRCPNCQCDSWGDIGQVLKMVRLSEVRSTSFERESRIDDRHEERQREPFIVHTHAKFEEQDVKISYQSRHADVPFGFEFIQRTQFTFVNHGQKSPDAPPIFIAGKEEAIGGLDICTACGKAKLPDGKQSDHEYYCRYRGKEEDPRIALSLYHQFESESIRILLPIAEHTGIRQHAESFCAALLMGLKIHYLGQVDHLQTIIQDAPIPNEQVRRTFIYLYDTVPGGTGYLKDLLTDKALIQDILEPALKKLQKCDCRLDKTKDGCYKCLFAYRNSFTRGAISRQTAISILEDIVDKGEGLEKIRSIEDIDVHRLVESTLEAAFLSHLNEWKLASRVTQHHGTNRFYQLKIGPRTWDIECQVSLNESVGVKKTSRPDFLLIPDQEANCLPIAVFMDGFAYHQDRLADDTLKRMAILMSGRYHVWSLTWDDLQMENTGEITDFFPLDSRRRSFTHFDNFIRNLESEPGGLELQKRARSRGSFDLLKAYLMDPDLDKWRALAYCHGVINVTETSSPESLRSSVPDWFMDDQFLRPNSNTGAFWTSDKHEPHRGCVAVNLVNNGSVDPTMLRAFVYLDDRAYSEPSFKPVWNGFLRAMNLFQFLDPQTGFFCASGLRDREYYDLLCIGEPLPVMPHAWRIALGESSGESYQPILRRLADKEAPAPEIGFEVTDFKNQILTTAEVAWPSQKVALFYSECWEDHSECEREGWKCLQLDELTPEDAPRILKLLEA